MYVRGAAAPATAIKMGRRRRGSSPSREVPMSSDTREASMRDRDQALADLDLAEIRLGQVAEAYREQACMSDSPPEVRAARIVAHVAAAVAMGMIRAKKADLR